MAVINCSDCSGFGAVFTDIDNKEIKKCHKCNGVGKVQNMIKPYSDDEYEEAKRQGLDLDDWDDYVKYFGIGEEPNYDDM
jgi:NAD-dependent SIR2 family protein deacetylase